MCMRDQPVIRQAWWEQHPVQSISDEVCPPQPVSASSSLFQPEDAMFSSLHGIATGVIILQLISLKMSLLILSNLRCDSMAVSDGLNPSFPHPLLPFPPPCSHLFSCAAVSACATSLCCSRELPTRLILAVRWGENNWVSQSWDPVPLSGGQWQEEVMLSFLFVLFLSGTSDDVLFAFFFPSVVVCTNYPSLYLLHCLFL